MSECKYDGCGRTAEAGKSRCRTCRRGDASKARPLVRSSATRVLLIDIETSLQLSYHFGMWNVNINPDMVVEPTRMLCFAAKWLGQSEVIFRSEHEHPHMVLDAWGLLDEADAVVHYYGSRFDIPHLNREFLEAGYPPPSPYRQIDLKMAVSKRFKFPSNKLQFVSQALGFEGKEQTGGMGLWRKCQEGDAKAWKKMQSYNEQDTRLLEDVYGRLLPWIPNLPNRHLFDGAGECPNCSDGPVIRDGVYRTALSVFPQYRCRACDSWLRGTKRISGAKLQQVAL